MQTTARMKPVQFMGKDIIVRELSLRKIGKLADAVEGLAGQLDRKAFVSEDMEQIVPAMIKLIRVAPEKIVEIVRLGADVAEDDVLDATPREIIGLFLEIWHVNNLLELFRKKLQPVLPPALGGPEMSAPGPSEA